jgi:ABC-2 type transport system ATP-binding protein
MISIQNLTKSYPSSGGRHHRGRRVEILQGVDLEVGRGEILGIAGPNGAGKTTLLEILATLVLPDAGLASIAGHDVVAATEAVRRLVAYCPASSQTFYPRLTGFHNLEFFAALHGLVGTAARDRICDALDAVGLDAIAGAPVQTYSDGMRQRLALARALVTDAAVLLLDEPTRSVDAAARSVIHRLLRETLVDGRGLTIVIVTHSVEEAVAVCDRVALLDRGRVTTTGSPAAVMESWV